MKVPTLTSFALSAILASLPVSLAANPELTCMKPAWDRELEVQIALQDGIAGVVIEAQPDLKEIAELSAASAKHDLTMTDALRTWIWETDPARLNTPEAYRAFSWTDEDRAAWVTANASAAALQALQDDLNAQLAAHPDVNAYFALLSEEAQQAQMLELTQDFSGRMAEASLIVSGCFTDSKP